MQNQRTQIGYLVGGGLKENFRVRLTVSPQEIQEGAFVVIQSGWWNYYGIVTDIQLGATDPRFADEQMEGRFPKHISDALHKKALYANLEVLPNLMLEVGPELGTPEYKDWQGKIDAGLKDAPRILPVKNIPPHHAVVSLANEGDIAEIFGDPSKESNFVIGFTREQNHPVCIDLDKFVQRSSAAPAAPAKNKIITTIDMTRWIGDVNMSCSILHLTDLADDPLETLVDLIFRLSSIDLPPRLMMRKLYMEALRSSPVR